MIITYSLKEQARFFRAMFWGGFGAGKTYLAASCSEVEEMGPVLIAATEVGTATAVEFSDVHGTKIRNVKEARNVAIDLAAGGHPYKTVVLDSVTALCDMVRAENVVENRSGEEDLRRTYGQVKAVMATLMRQFMALDMHVIFLAREREVYPENHPPDKVAKRQGLVKIAVDLPKAVAREADYLVDHSWYIKAGEDKTRHVLTSPTGLYREIKTRGPALQKELGDVITDPNMSQIYAAQLEAIGE